MCQEIEEELKRLSESGQRVKKLSMIGYSLGGLVARYTVGLLESRGLFDEIEAIVTHNPLPTKKKVEHVERAC